jgi:segregation and condensation protein B
VSDEQQNLSIVIPDEAERRSLLEAIIYVAEEPLTLEQIAAGLELPIHVVQTDLDALVEETAKSGRGVEVRSVAGGYKMSTKAQHHEAVRKFVKTLRPKLKLSLPALETLAVIAYKQPVTLPEVQAVRGVNASATIHTLLNHKLVTTAGRKQVIGKPIQYKTTREFLVQFGLNDLSELPNLKELEELSRAALGEGVEEPAPAKGSEAAGAREVPETGEWPDANGEDDAEPFPNGETGESEEIAGREAVAEASEEMSTSTRPSRANGRVAENDESETQAEVVGRG